MLLDFIIINYYYQYYLHHHWCSQWTRYDHLTSSSYVAGIVAVIFSIMSRMVASTDYEGARVKGQIAMFISVAGIIVSVVGVLIFVMIFYTKDT